MVAPKVANLVFQKVKLMAARLAAKMGRT
jgi:hypothetical protein